MRARFGCVQTITYIVDPTEFEYGTVDMYYLSFSIFDASAKLNFKLDSIGVTIDLASLMSNFSRTLSM